MSKPIAPENLTVADIERAAKMPASTWHGNCYGLACVAARLIGKLHTAVYGHYLGKVDPDGYWSRRIEAPFQQHGWVLLADGRVLDPTRWSFENVAPYIFVSSSASHPDYDEGGNAWRQSLMRPPPKRDEKWGNGPKTTYTLRLGPEAATLVASMIGPAEVVLVLAGSAVSCTTDQVFWLANAPYDAYGKHVFAVYSEICRTYGSPAIPIDNQRRAEREAGEALPTRRRAKKTESAPLARTNRNGLTYSAWLADGGLTIHDARDHAYDAWIRGQDAKGYAKDHPPRGPFNE
jgi:hypothetical protein